MSTTSSGVWYSAVAPCRYPCACAKPDELSRRSIGRRWEPRARGERAGLLLAAAPGQLPDDGGSSTVSITWITPFDAGTSVFTTLDLFPWPSVITTSFPSVAIVNDAPFTVFTAPGFTSAAITFPATTWYVRMPASLSLLSGFSNEATVPAGSFANASFVGANTVNGPAPDNVSASPAAFTAATSVENCGFDAATPTTVCGAGAVVAGPGAMVAGDVGSAPAAPFVSLLDEHAPSSSAAESAA